MFAFSIVIKINIFPNNLNSKKGYGCK